MSNKRGNIFDDSNCLSTVELLAYAEGRLSGAGAHRAERHLVDCELCSDALEGILHSGSINRVPQIISELNERIDAVTKGQSGKGSFFSFRRIAAVVVLLIVTGGLWYYISNINRGEKLFSQYYEPFNKAADSVVASKPTAREEVQGQSAPAVSEKEVRSETRTAAATERDKTVSAVKAPVAETARNENVSGQAAVKDMAASKAEETVTQNEGAAASGDENTDALKEDEVKAVQQVTSVGSKEISAVSKNTAPAAFNEKKRETEFADVKVDATQLQRATLQDAIRNYEAKDYEEAFQYAEKFLKKFPKDPEGLFYSGVSALSLKKEKVAAQRLKDCLATDSQQWKEEASWYLSLCYIKLNKQAEAKTLLQFLSGSNSEHAAEAKKMLESIR